MINFSCGSTAIAILLLVTAAYGQCEYNTHSIYMFYSTILVGIHYIREYFTHVSNSKAETNNYSNYNVDTVFCMCVCVRACVRAFVRACVLACMDAC